MKIPEGTGKKLAVSQEIIQFGGLNKTNDYAEGDLENCDRVTLDGWPYLDTFDCFYELERGSGSGKTEGIIQWGNKIIEIYDGGKLRIDGEQKTVIDQKDQTRESIYYDPARQVDGGLRLCIVNEWMFYGDRYALNLETLRLKIINNLYTKTYKPVIDTYGNLALEIRRVVNEENGHVFGLSLENAREWGAASCVPMNEENALYEFGNRLVAEDYGTDFTTVFPVGSRVDLSPGPSETGTSALAPGKQRLTVTDAGVGFLKFDKSIHFYSAYPQPESYIPEGEEAFSGSYYSVGNFVITAVEKVFDVYLSNKNRLWGAENASNTIYASALGDLFAVEQYEGLSTDSYAVAVTSDGPFTGGCALGDRVLFFKQDRVYEIFGDYPAEYTMYEYVCPGVREGADRTIVVIEDTVFYLGERGVFSYRGGGKPTLVSRKLGDLPRQFSKVYAANVFGDYYLFAQQNETCWAYRLDLTRGDWVKHDLGAVNPIDGIQRLDGPFALYCNGVAEDENGKIINLTQDRRPFGYGRAWFAEFKPFRGWTDGKKRVRKLRLRLSLGVRRSWVRVLLKKDAGRWVEIRTITRTTDDNNTIDFDGAEQIVEIPIHPNRGATHRIRLEGEGVCRIMALGHEKIKGGLR